MAEPWRRRWSLLGSLGSVIVLARLGKSFSIMPEARNLVTSGPYAWPAIRFTRWRFITLFGTAMQFQQPWAMLLALGVIALAVVRTAFEERVLADAYPEYASYRARVKRFGLSDRLVRLLGTRLPSAR